MADEGAPEQLDALMDGFIAEEAAPGIAYGVFRDGDLIDARGIGVPRFGASKPPNADTVFRIASMTKSFTAATVLLLRDEGLVRLDDPIGEYVPELADVRAPQRGSPTITVRHLLTMSAGLPTDDPWGDRQQDLDLERFAAFLRGGQSFAWMPATEFEYSNLGYGILGRLITNVAGREYRDVVQSRLLEPLEMTSTWYSAEDVPHDRLATGYTLRDDAFLEEPFAGYGALASMGGLFSTVRDLGRWMDGFAKAFDEQGKSDGHPLRRASRLEMQQGSRLVPPDLTWTSISELPTAFVSAYGFGLFVGVDLELGAVISHPGGYPGFGSNMRWHPASGIALVVLGNRTYWPAAKIADRMLRLVVRAGIAPRRPLTRAPAVDAARDAVERLLFSWDDDVAARIFAMNVELDEPLEHRKAGIERLQEVHGDLRRSDEPPVSHSPMHLEWWLEGDRGRVRVEISLDPEPEPLIQKLELTSVPEPDPWVVAVATALVAMANGEAVDLEAAEDVDRATLERDALMVRTLFGRSRLGASVAAERGRHTFRVHAERGDLDIELSADAGAARLTGVKWIPRPIESRPFDAR